MLRLSIGAALAVSSLTCAQAADFAGVGGPIPDNNANGISIPINVSGILGPVGDVRVTVPLTHTFAGDLRVTLTAPNNAGRLILFARAGYRRNANAGVSNNLVGTYTFTDSATNSFWSTLADGDVPAGSYRTSSAGAPSLSAHGGCDTSLSLAFAGLSGAQVNGNWTLNVADLASGDTGNVGNVLLSIDVEPQIFADGYDEDVPAIGVAGGSRDCVTSFNDLTGTGLASYTVVRNTGGGPQGEVTWFVKENNGSTSGAETNFIHGVASDFFMEGDWDGDGIGDATVWRAGAVGKFIVRRSSHPVPLLEIPFGRTGDDADQLGDYDGDGITDPAVYRSGAMSGQPSFFIVRYSSTGQQRIFQTGENGAFPSAGSDYDGDGRADIAIQSNAGGGVARFRLFSGLDGAMFDDFNFGTPTDVIITGTHTGSRVGDITVIRGMAGVINWSTRDGETGIGQPLVQHGASATDFPLAGDFDGDGVDDYAVWRPSATPGMSKFIVRRSLTPAVPLELPWGQNGDYPPANSRTH